VNIETIISKAVESALKSNHLKYRVGAVIFDKGKIISCGSNNICRSVKHLHPRFQTWKGSVHAEVAAIIKAKKNLKSCSILVLRLNRNNEFRFSKPCYNCMMYINYVGIRKVYYTTGFGNNIDQLDSEFI
jgi:deoxycytidylate deaminase